MHSSAWGPDGVVAPGALVGVQVAESETARANLMDGYENHDRDLPPRFQAGMFTVIGVARRIGFLVLYQLKLHQGVFLHS